MKLLQIVTKQELKSSLIAIPVFTLILINGSGYLLTAASYGFLIAILSFGWNLTALTGEISLGHAGFFGIGAYVAVISGISGINSVLSVFIGALAAGVYGAITSLSFYRLSGVGFALASIAFSQIPKIVAENLSITGAGSGIVNIKPLFIIKSINTPLREYIMGASLLIILLIFTAFAGKKIWLKLSAIRQNRIAAEALGIATIRYKQINMLISSFIFGFVGALWTYWIGYINPDTAFDLYFSTAPLIGALFGGRNSLIGPIIGALILYLSDSAISMIFPVGHKAVYGLAILVTIMALRGGIFKAKKAII